MDRTPAEALELEHHRLELRFAPARLVRCRRLESLVRSLEHDGQLTALIAVPAARPPSAPAPGSFVLIDGYRRLAALRRLGRDTARVEVWPMAPEGALLALLARTQALPFEPLEEALLLRELTAGAGLSYREVARGCARDVSWVSRRLALLASLPEPVLAALAEGRLSCWAASRVLAPLARANTAHAERLLEVLRETPLPTRALRQWFEAYTRASRSTRERLVEHPALFVQAREAARVERSAALLGAGPEGEWRSACERAAAQCRALRGRLGALRTVPLTELLDAFTPLEQAFERLVHDLHRSDCDDPDRDPRDGPRPCRARGGAARDEPPAQALAQHRSPHPQSPRPEHPTPSER